MRYHFFSLNNILKALMISTYRWDVKEFYFIFFQLFVIIFEASNIFNCNKVLAKSSWAQKSHSSFKHINYNQIKKNQFSLTSHFFRIMNAKLEHWCTSKINWELLFSVSVLNIFHLFQVYKDFWQQQQKQQDELQLYCSVVP